MMERTIAGRYRVVDRLGTGGMAEVWRAEDEVLGRSVAVKILHPQYASEENFVARFRQEAQAAANLSHPNIVNVYDWGREDDTYFIVMEYLPGKNLKEILEERGNLRPDQAIEIGRQVASALAYAHKSGIVHRDIKPHNIILSREGQVKVTDFGIARVQKGGQLTQTGSVMGTAQYISPEQAQGKETTPSTDIYSLGIVLYELLTGSVPFDGESAVAVALKQVNEHPVAPRALNSAIPGDLEKVVLKAMAKQPELRYRGADELAEDLTRVSQGTAPRRADDRTTAVMPTVPAGSDVTAVMPAAGAPSPAGGRPGRVERRKSNTWVWVVVVLLLVIAATGGAWALISGSLPKTVEAPDLVGMDVKAASKLLSEKNLRLGQPIEQRNDETIPAGQVMSQDPPAGTELKEGDSVRVVVSLGKATVTVQDFIGLPSSEAMRQIVNAGLVVGKVTKRADDNYPEDTVLAQTPKSGATVAKGTAVDLVVSSGKARVTVPDVVGMKLADARAKLKEYGLGSEVIQGFSDEPTGNVYDQSPDAGSDVTSGAVVTIRVSKGPEMVTVPDVTTLDEATAKGKLESLGFFVVKDTMGPLPPADPNIGKVMNQDPVKDTKAKKGSQVTIYVGSAT